MCKRPANKITLYVFKKITKRKKAKGYIDHNLSYILFFDYLYICLDNNTCNIY